MSHKPRQVLYQTCSFSVLRNSSFALKKVDFHTKTVFCLQKGGNFGIKFIGAGELCMFCIKYNNIIYIVVGIKDLSQVVGISNHKFAGRYCCSLSHYAN